MLSHWPEVVGKLYTKGLRTGSIELQQEPKVGRGETGEVGFKV